MDTNSRTARWEPRSFKDIAFLTCTTLTEYHRAHKTKVKELSCKIKSSSLKRNVTPSHAWTAHCTSCSQDKNLIIQKNTHDSPMTGNVTAEDVLSCWKDHRALTVISALWFEEFLPSSCSLTLTHSGAGQVLPSRPAAHRVRNCPWHQDSQTQTIISQAVPTRMCQTLGLKAQPEAESPSPLLPQSVSETHLCQWSIFLPPSVLENLQANPSSFPLEMHFLQM